jgi:hypothetical protein
MEQLPRGVWRWLISTRDQQRRQVEATERMADALERIAGVLEARDKAERYRVSPGVPIRPSEGAGP